MKTRTLLLLSVVTGMLILVAGTVQLLRVASQDEAEPLSEIGEPVEVGDMTVTVDGSSERDGVLSVDLTIGGTDDPNGGRDFQVIVPGDVIEPIAGAGVGAGDANGPGRTDEGPARCGATTETVTRCRLDFDVSDAAGDTRTLRYQRGEESARWLLSSK